MAAPDTCLLRGELFDGVSARAVPVTVALDATGELLIRGAAGERRVPLSGCRLGPAVGGIARRIGLPDGASIETRDLELLADWEERTGPSRGTRLVQRLESSWRSVAITAVVLALAVVFAWIWGLPAAARAIAFRLPASVAATVGAEVQPEVERRRGLQPTTLPLERQAALGRAFDRLVAEAGSPDFHYELQFRDSRSGEPNAIALPSGTILLTDELVALSGRDEELLAVLAHELTHVEQRHGIRAALQGAGAAFLLGVLFGDMKSDSSLGTSLSAVFVQAGYSREFEREADRGAVRWCRQRGWGAEPLRTLLGRLDRARPETAAPGWMSSHPEMEERLRALGD